MARSYYTLWYRLEGSEGYLIWYGDETDGLVLRGDGRLWAFAARDELLRRAEALSLPIEREEPILHDLDILARWLKNPTAETVDCGAFLQAWNLFLDLR